MLYKFKHEKAAPTNLFAKNCGEIFDDGNVAVKQKYKAMAAPPGRGPNPNSLEKRSTNDLL